MHSVVFNLRMLTKRNIRQLFPPLTIEHILSNLTKINLKIEQQFQHA